MTGTKKLAYFFIRSTWAPRVLGLVLLLVLLVRADLGQVSKTLRAADVSLIVAAIALILPLIYIKTLRWQIILRSQGLSLRTWPAYLAYLGSMFIGFLTPGRLGEFVRALHVSRELRVSQARAFAGVLADRLFDLYLLLVVGGLAVIVITEGPVRALAVALTALIAVLPAAWMLSSKPPARSDKTHAHRPGRLRGLLSTFAAWVYEVRVELGKLTGRHLAAAGVLTVLAYLVFFTQCYLLALALNLDVGFIEVCLVISLGSLVTLVPISISGLGTREAISIAYLGALGVPAGTALGYSLLVFLTFYVAGGLMGAVAWWLKPASLSLPRLKLRSSSPRE